MRSLDKITKIFCIKLIINSISPRPHYHSGWALRGTQNSRYLHSKSKVQTNFENLLSKNTWSLECLYLDLLPVPKGLRRLTGADTILGGIFCDFRRNQEPLWAEESGEGNIDWGERGMLTATLGLRLRFVVY